MYTICPLLASSDNGKCFELYEYMTMQYAYFSYVVKIENFHQKCFDNFAEAVLTSIHNLCYGAKIRKKNMYTSVYPMFAK